MRIIYALFAVIPSRTFSDYVYFFSQQFYASPYLSPLPSALAFIPPSVLYVLMSTPKVRLLKKTPCLGFSPFSSSETRGVLWS